jgi:hypothetical protein
MEHRSVTVAKQACRYLFQEYIRKPPKVNDSAHTQLPAALLLMMPAEDRRQYVR